MIQSLDHNITNRESIEELSEGSKNNVWKAKLDENNETTLSELPVDINGASFDTT